LFVSFLFVVRAFVIIPSTYQKFKNEVNRHDSKLKASNKLYGGDFAGLSANFSPKDGKLIRVPDHLVPKEILEWEKSPSCLEVLVSEEGGEEEETWSRQTVSVLPAVGCGVDNLETTKKEEEMLVQSVSVADDVVSFDVEYEDEDNKKKRRRTETIFAVGDNDDKNCYRLRVLLDIAWEEDGGFVIEEPINVILERRVNETSSGGTIADQGGLTGSRVTELLGGGILKASSFCEASPTVSWGDTPQGIKLLNLPGNVTIACYEDPMQSPMMLDIVHLNINKKGEANQQMMRRSYNA